MAPAYNPIVRTFCRLRAVLVDLGVDRRLVRPATPLDVLIPPGRLAEVLARLREAGLPAPELERRLREHPLWWLAASAVLLAFFSSLLLQSWLLFLLTAPPAAALVWLACTVTRTRTVSLPLGPRTAGEMVIHLTRFGDHPGYRFSRREIALKVRLVVAGWMGGPVEQVREDSSFVDPDSWGRPQG